MKRHGSSASRTSSLIKHDVGDVFGWGPSTVTVDALDLRAHPEVFPATWTRVSTPPARFRHMTAPCDSGSQSLEGVVWNERAKLYLFSQGDRPPVYDVTTRRWNGVTDPAAALRVAFQVVLSFQRSCSAPTQRVIPCAPESSADPDDPATRHRAH